MKNTTFDMMKGIKRKKLGMSVIVSPLMTKFICSNICQLLKLLCL